MPVTFKRVKQAINKFVDELKKQDEKLTPEAKEQSKEEFTKYLDDLKKDAKKRYKIDLVYKQLDKAHLNELIETGIFAFDNIFDACTDAGQGFSSREVAAKVNGKVRWVDGEKLQKAYHNPKYANESSIAMDAIKGDAVQTVADQQMANDVASIMIPKYMGYGALSPYQSNIWVRKIINMKARSIYGKGFGLSGDGSERTRQDIKLIYDAMSQFKVKKLLITALKRTYLFGGVSIVPKLKNVSDEGLKKELKFNNSFIPKDSLEGFNVVSPYFCTPMIPNTTNATGNFYYDPEHWFLIDKLIHSSRIINMATDVPDEYQSPLYYYRGISIVQSLLKYIFQIIISGNSTANSLLQNSLWLMKTSANYMTDKNFQQMIKKIAAERNNSMIVPLKTPDEFYILQIDISHNAETARFFQETIATLLDAPHTLFMGIAAKGLTASGTQEMKNWHDVVQSERVDLGYDDALVSVLNYVQSSVLGRLNPTITIENVELDESYDMNRVQSSIGFTQMMKDMWECGVIDQQFWMNAISQAPYHVLNKIAQMQIEGRNNIPDETNEHNIPDAKLNETRALDELQSWDSDELDYWMTRNVNTGEDVINFINRVKHDESNRLTWDEMVKLGKTSNQV